MARQLILHVHTAAAVPARGLPIRSAATGHLPLPAHSAVAAAVLPQDLQALPQGLPQGLPVQSAAEAAVPLLHAVVVPHAVTAAEALLTEAVLPTEVSEEEDKDFSHSSFGR